MADDTDNKSDEIEEIDEVEEIDVGSQHWSRWMRVLRYAIALACLGLMVWAAKAFYPPARNNHLIRMAKVFIRYNEFRNASLSLRQALVSDDRNIDAILLMAELSELSNSPQTLIWRKRAVEVAPEHVRYRMDYVKSALKLGETSVAAEALATIDEAGRRTAAYHHLAASIAIAWKQIAKAEFHASKALELEPDNDGYKFNLGLLWLQLADETRQRKGAEIVRAMVDHSEFRSRALRSLAADAAARGDLPTALSNSWDLQLEVDSTLNDRVTHLTLLEKAKDPKADEFLASLRTVVSKDPEAILSVVMATLRPERSRETLAWIDSLPAAVQTSFPVRMATAECYAAARNWDELKKFLDLREWDNLEFLRRAYYARIHRAQGKEELFTEAWDEAIQHATRKTGPLSLLNRLAGEWGWTKESDDLLWDVAGGQFNNIWALEQLYQKYEKAGDSRSLYQVILRLLELKPNDLVAQNNFALLSLLLNVRHEQAIEVARALYSRHSKNPVILSTYAYSLLAQNKVQAALNVFGALSPEQLEDPNVAAYYSLALHAAGKPADAAKYASLAKSARLLPEERALLQKVM